MTVKLLTKHNLELKGAEQARLSLHLSKSLIVGNHMSRPIIIMSDTYLHARHSLQLIVEAYITEI